jgi:anti-sigma B factor antagonist/stage II sporulation protein AA (anti-sigma F factor antagonist)
MLDFEKQISGEILIEIVNLPRATTVEASIIKKRLFDDIHLSKKKIIVDMSKCDFIDEIFLGALVVSLKRSREIGGEIKVVIDPSVAKKTTNITGFLKVFKNYSSVEDALNSFRS